MSTLFNPDKGSSACASIEAVLRLLSFHNLIAWTTRCSVHTLMLRTLPALQRHVLQRAAAQARCYARDAQRPAVEDILVPDEGLVVLDGCVMGSCP